MMKKVLIPEFEIYSNPTIKIVDIVQRRFSLIDRERSCEFIFEELKTCSDIKDYIFNYIKRSNKTDNLRIAIEKFDIQYIEVLDKLLVLK